ncbi:phage tail protein [Desulfobaculum bizertense]|uniref:phage tail protein n=1 Tax=Desulfobaculum bizertense TaxID=376490 RepID=UPI001F419D45|nr:phage tail protein [Desulfobaculum bizertense]UIJ38557.1 phage tail protein [Desulfobaculum bizertense]
MSEKFGMLLTDAGRLKLLRVPLGGTLGISHVVVGDGSGAAVLPAPHMEALVHEVYRTAPAAVDVVDGGEIASGKVWLQVEAVIPVEAGGFWVRELGLLAADGTLVAVGNYPDSYKPTLDSGIGKDMYLKAIIELASADAEKVELVVDPSVVLATREFVGREVDRALAEMTEHIGNKGNPHAVSCTQIGAATQSALDSHKAAKNNPHSVTAEQIGAATWNLLPTEGMEVTDYPDSISSIGTSFPNKVIRIGGLIIQLMFFSYAANGGEIKTALEEFPNAMLNVQITDGGPGVHVWGALPISASQFQIWGKEINRSGYSTGFGTALLIGY